ncbi:MAG: histidine--tRNA ligase [Candidatus Woesearchaeota archaeon]
MAKFSKVKGTLDYYPNEAYIKNKIFSVFKTTARAFNFQEIDVPCIESFELLAAKQGEEIKEQIFNLERKGSERLALRAEFTPSFARTFIEKHKELQKPVKWFTIGKVWRYERPQAGRQREFFQFNAEVYGSNNPEADAEVINLAIECLVSLGLRTNDFFVKINNRKLLTGLLMEIIKEKNEEDLAKVLRVIDKKKKISEKMFEEELSFLRKEQIESIKSLFNIDIKILLEKNLNKPSKEGLLELMEVLKYTNKDFVRFDMSVVRGLAYYTGTVFEIFDSEEKFRSLCGGGRYDNLLAIYGCEKTPATGFGMGLSTLSMLLKDKGLIPEPEMSPDYYIAIISDAAREEAINIASILRKKRSVEIDIMRRNLSNQIKYAKSIKAKKMVVIGEDELKTKKIKIKDLATGEEKSMGLKEFLADFKDNVK